MGTGSLGNAARAATLAFALVFTVGASTNVAAQEETQSTVQESSESTITQYGFRGGFSFSPDQFVAGAFMGFRDIRPGFGLRPSLDIGLGNGGFAFVLNANGQYHFRGADFPAVPYAGAGIAVGYYDADGPDNSSTDVGVNMFGGLEWDLGGYRIAFAEFQLGLGDAPEVKIVGGFGFL